MILNQVMNVDPTKISPPQDIEPGTSACQHSMVTVPAAVVVKSL